jgi:hypothetical protein
MQTFQAPLPTGSEVVVEDVHVVPDWVIWPLIWLQFPCVIWYLTAGLLAPLGKLTTAETPVVQVPAVA